jgi:ParB family chromosome partitioning protein
MADKSGQTFALPKKSSLVADMFTTQEQRDDAKREKVLDIPLTDIDAFPDHPFQVKLDEAMQAMADSVKAVGIQSPAIVRQKEDGRYELVSGHRRKMACELAGLETLPCIVRELSRDKAIIAMVDANLQREVILPSEKAKSYKMRLDAMKRQAGRPSKNSVPVAQNFEGKTSRELLGEKVGESQDQVRRYIRLNELKLPEVAPSMVSVSECVPCGVALVV